MNKKRVYRKCTFMEFQLVKNRRKKIYYQFKFWKPESIHASIIVHLKILLLVYATYTLKNITMLYLIITIKCIKFVTTRFTMSILPYPYCLDDVSGFLLFYKLIYNIHTFCTRFCGLRQCMYNWYIPGYQKFNLSMIWLRYHFLWPLQFSCRSLKCHHRSILIIYKTCLWNDLRLLSFIYNNVKKIFKP